MTRSSERHYKPTEAKYKGGAHEMYVTYDIAQHTRGGNEAMYPKVKRIYIAGKVQGWNVGDFTKRTGRTVHGVKIDYEQTRSAYHRQPFTAQRGKTRYKVSEAKVGRTASTFSEVVEVPRNAQNVSFHKGKLPRKYQHALQHVK